MSDARTHVHWRSKELETQSESQSENGGSDDTSAESPERARSDTEPISPRSENLRHPQSVFRNKYEEILFDDGEEEYERAHCCNGLIPLEPLVATTHIFVAAGGLGGIGLASFQISRGYPTALGMDSLQHLIVSASLLLPIFSILTGLLLMLCSALGLYQNYLKMRANVTVPSQLDLTYHSMLFLSTMISLVFLIATLSTLTYSFRNSHTFDEEKWSQFVHVHPKFMCGVERRLQCAGSASDQCIKGMSNEVRFTNCPGLFCHIFCRSDRPEVDADNADENFMDHANVQPMCSFCIRVGGRAALFKDCAVLESNVRDSRGCLEPFVDDLRTAFVTTSYTVLIYSVCMGVLGTITLYRHCCIYE